jgi:hypothetical protein
MVVVLLKIVYGICRILEYRNAIAWPKHSKGSDVVTGRVAGRVYGDGQGYSPTSGVSELADRVRARVVYSNMVASNFVILGKLAISYTNVLYAPPGNRTHS